MQAAVALLEKSSNKLACWPLIFCRFGRFRPGFRTRRRTYGTRRLACRPFLPRLLRKWRLRGLRRASLSLRRFRWSRS